MLIKQVMALNTFNKMIIQETLDNVQVFKHLAIQLGNLWPILLKVNEMETKGASADVVNFLEKVEGCVS